MNTATLIRRNLVHYWRTNAAVAVGVATAVAVLAGALLVGESVRRSLRDLVLLRLGYTDQVVTSSGFFREQLADDLRADPTFGAVFRDVCPITTGQGLVSDQATGLRASGVHLYGIDDRFWRFHGLEGRHGPADRDALLSPALAREIGTTAGGTVLLKVQRPSVVPIESLHGRKEALGRTLRLTVRDVLTSTDLGEFSLRPQQGDVRAMFVPLTRLQQDLDLPGRVNTLLLSTNPSGGDRGMSTLTALLRQRARFEDLGLKLRTLGPQQALSLDSDAGLIDDARAGTALKAVEGTGMKTLPVLTYLANSLRSGTREIPYSLVAAVDLRTIIPKLSAATASAGAPPVVLNDWAARDLGATIGDPIALAYYVWEEPGRLVTRSANFQIAGIVPIEGMAADRDLAPVFPGITDSPNLGDWDPPFTIDLGRVRPVDEDYWRTYRTTPKAFIPLEVGQALWRSRYGSLTSIRILPGGERLEDAAVSRYVTALRGALDPLALGLTVYDARAEGLSASEGATDFASYFAYFSTFLIISALLLTALFFRLGIEQRVQEIGLLEAIGFTGPKLRQIFIIEGLALAALGSVLGVLGAIGYAGLMMWGLRTEWVDAVGTRLLTLHVSVSALGQGVVGAIVAAVVCIWWTLRRISVASARVLLTGMWTAPDLVPTTAREVMRRSVLIAVAAATGLGGVAVLVAAAAGWLGRTAGFFGAGTAMLASLLAISATWLRSRSGVALVGHGWWPLWRLGFRNASYRPGRSLVCTALIALATFTIVAVEAFKAEDPASLDQPRSGTGGYALLMDSLVPIAHDLNSREGREALNLPSGRESALADVTFFPFRVRPGDDASCLNLYQPSNPRILAPSDAFLAAGRFAFRTVQRDEGLEPQHPWRLLERPLPDGAVPAIADATSMTYVLHRQVGDEIAIGVPGRPAIRLRLVAALADSIFQSALVISDRNFLRLFPDQHGYRFFLIDAPRDRVDEVAGVLESRLEDQGADILKAAERLAEYKRVEYTYLATFQTLGALGLLLGTVGLGAVLTRNVLERRRELALLRALGYTNAHFLAMVVAENTLLLLQGLGIGTACALLAIAPALSERTGALPLGGLVALLGLVLATGLMASVGAGAATLRSPLLAALRGD